LKNHSHFCRNKLEAEYKIQELNNKLAEASLTIIQNKRNTNIELVIERNSLLRMKSQVRNDHRSITHVIVPHIDSEDGRDSPIVQNTPGDIIMELPPEDISTARTRDTENSLTIHFDSTADSWSQPPTPLIWNKLKPKENSDKNDTKISSLQKSPKREGLLLFDLTKETPLKEENPEDEIDDDDPIAKAIRDREKNKKNSGLAAKNDSVNVNNSTEPSLNSPNRSTDTQPKKAVAKFKPVLKKSTTVGVQEMNNAIGDMFQPITSPGQKRAQDDGPKIGTRKEQKVLTMMNPYEENRAHYNNLWRDKLQKIKSLNTRMKGYSTLTNYINLIQNIDEYSHEAKVVSEEAKRDISHHLENIKDEKFISCAVRVLELIKRKYEAMKSLDINRKELEGIDISPKPAYSQGSSSRSRSKRGSVALSVDTNEESQESHSGQKNSIVIIDDTKLLRNQSTNQAKLFEKKRTVHFRSKSVEKPKLTVRYEIFEKNLRKIINKIKKERAKNSETSNIVYNFFIF